MKKSSRTIQKLIAILAVIALITGCGSASGGSGGSGGGGGQAASEVPEKEGVDFAPAEFKDAVFSPEAAEGNAEAQVDLSHVSQGYIALQCSTDARVKLQVFKGEDTYVYDVVQDKPQIFPLQLGDGDYTFKVMKNVEDNKYFELYGCSASVALDGEFEPFLRPNQYADYTASSRCVERAAQLAQGATSEEAFIMAVYDDICGSITYDREKAANIQSGYIPEPDKIMEEGQGICFDYASLGASMLRSQGIPTKIVFGYVAPDDLYHAWNMFYTQENGWTTVEFSVSPGDWSRVDLTFSANGADGDFIGDGTNYMDVYYY